MENSEKKFLLTLEEVEKIYSAGFYDGAGDDLYYKDHADGKRLDTAYSFNESYGEFLKTFLGENDESKE